MSDTLFNNSTDVETVRGTLGRIIYNEHGRVIAKFSPDAAWLREGTNRTRKISTVLGSMVEPMEGQIYELTGKIDFDERYKTYQLSFESYRTILPTDRIGIFSYLVDVARWIGPAIAQKIVNSFGDDTLTILKTQPEKIIALNIPGLMPSRVTEMQASLAENEAVEAATIEVANLLGGVLGPAQVRKAVKKWKCNAPHIIKKNPYVLTELHGVGFISADKVASKLGVDPQDLSRHSAALGHILAEAAQRDGHTKMTKAQVVSKGNELVGGLRQEVWEACVRDEAIETREDIISAGGLAKAERYVAGKIAWMLSPTGKCAADRSHLYPEIFTEGLAGKQVDAANAFKDAPIFALVGAPGTGKTYTTARLVRSCIAGGLRVLLCAPTGKAAKQMTLALSPVGGGMATTIHSMLGPAIDEETGEFRFSRDESDPLDADLVVIDEFSMVDITLARALFRAISDVTRVLIVGDHYQLPSVGPGAVLRDLLAAGIPHVELTEIHRNAGTIVRACHSIKDGRTPEPVDKLDLQAESPANWRHVEAGGPDEIKDVIRRIITEQLPKFSIDPLWGCQVISPVNERGELSCDALNELVKELVNPTGVNEGKLSFGLGDKVVRLKNGYARGFMLPDDDAATTEGGEETGVQTRRVEPLEDEIRIVNGDVGIVTGFEARTIAVQLRYPNRRVKIPRAENQLRQAYCMTCHKMQGSEVPVVVLPLHRSFAKLPMVTREWLYTAMSRAKLFVVTVGDLDVMRPIVARVGNTRRQTGLAERIRIRRAAPAPVTSIERSRAELQQVLQEMEL